MTPAPQFPLPSPWWADHGEIAALLRWLHARSQLTLDDAIYLVEKPWKWDREHAAMLAGEREAA